MQAIPKEYREAGKLHEILLISIRDSWPRIREDYNSVYTWLERTDRERDIDKALLARFRKDIRQDGAFFISTPDGIASRLSGWIREAFPQAFY